MIKKVIAQNLDAQESAFFARELEFVKSRSYDVLYPEYTAKSLFPVSAEAGSGAEQITYEQYDRVGLMKVIASYADDLPRSDVKGEEFTTPVRSIGGSYGYNVQEIRASQMAGKGLSQRKADATRQAYEQEVNDIAWFARPASKKYAGLTGFLYNSNTTKSSPTTGNWIAGSATADQIIQDVSEAITLVRTNTKGVERPDTVRFPIAEYGHIATTPRSSTSDTTILEFLRKVHPGVDFGQEGLVELSGVSPAPSGGSPATQSVMIVYKRDPMKLTLEIPQPYEQFPAQERNLEYVIPAHGRIGGVIIYYPLSVNIVEGI